MPDPQRVDEVLRRQVAELDGIHEQAKQDLNAVRGTERVAQWKARTVPLLLENLGRDTAQRFRDQHAGPSFSQDLLEELGDEVEMYRAFLLSLMKKGD